MKIVAYYRVSTRRSGEGGLGLGGQLVALNAYAKEHAGCLVAQYVEIESGRKVDRPELRRALAHARRSKANLVVARLDGLARNAAFLSALRDAGVEFVACDQPHANRRTVEILAAVAEDETRRVSGRTKVALAAAKARGAKLGSARPGHWKGREAARLEGARRGAVESVRVRMRAAGEAYAELAPLVAALHTKGASLRAIAMELNRLGHTTRRGLPWNPMQVGRVLKRAAAE